MYVLYVNSKLFTRVPSERTGLTMKIGAVINRASGTRSPRQMEELVKEIRQYLEPHVAPGYMAFVSGKEVRREINRLKDKQTDLIFTGGGDGTVSTAAELLSNTEIVLAVIPLGTRNNFAGDLEIPEQPEEAIRLLDRMKVEQIDIGNVNGHTFINNATLGLYPEIVEKREETIRKSGWKKWPAHMTAALNVLRWLPQMRLTVRSEQQQSYRMIPFLFVGNNEYRGSIVDESHRPSLSTGKLWFCMPYTPGFFSLLRTAWQLIRRGFNNIDNLETQLVTDLTVYSGRRALKVALDGENHRLTPPLQFTIQPKSLRVLVP